jgi:uncharacterized protein involved in exopolysaccharide biosynthesis
MSQAPIISWSEIVTTLAGHSRTLVAVVFGVGLAAVAVLLVVPSDYKASISFVAETRAPAIPGQFASLASLAGINLNAATPQQSPQFYAAVLTSRPILYAVLERRFPTTGLPGGSVGQDSATLLTLLAARGDSEEERLWNGARRLALLTDIRTDSKTGMIQLAVELRAPVLAAAVANAFAEELNRFNREVRQSQARTRRIFVEARVREVSADLAEAEEAVRRFLTSNRDYDNSPRLRFEYARLQRALTVQQELYLDLRRQLDAARIAEADDLPAITIVEAAIPPERRSGPWRLLWLAASLVLSTALFGATVVAREHHKKLFPGGATALAALTASWRRRRS